MRLSLDTETTGLDFRHGTRPFFVTTCDEHGRRVFWEWDVNPITREPIIPPGDLEEIKDHIGKASSLILQNAKFDVAALGTICPEIRDNWRWEDTHDTLIMAHLLSSGMARKDLSTLALTYLRRNIAHYEEALKIAVKAARSHVRSNQRRWAPEKRWSIATEEREDMPSAGGENIWRADGWLPRAVAQHEGFEPGHLNYNWHTVLADYANADSEVTVALFPVMMREIVRRGLKSIYEVRRDIPKIAHEMEHLGVTIHRGRLEELIEDYRQFSDEKGRVCKAIAQLHEYDLVLPKSGNNNSLKVFLSEKLCLPVIKTSDTTGAPSYDAKVIETYEATLNPKSRAHAFIRSLRQKRKKDTQISYMEGYLRFMIPLPAADRFETDSMYDGQWYLLHPVLNPTGTATLRWSSSNPNEQNISKQKDETGRNLRYCYGPTPEYEWWSMDAKNIELRIPAYESGEQELIALFERPDDPPYYGSNHLLVSHILHPERWAALEREVGPDKAGPEFKKRYADSWYQWVKNGNFAVQYGAIDKEDGSGTADRAYHIPRAQARIKDRFRKLEALNQRWIRYAERHGYVETIPDRTVDPERGYPLMCTRTEQGRILPTVPLNYHVQGTAMWWTTRAMQRCQRQLETWRREGFDCRIVMQVHDEIVFQFPKSEKHPSEDLEREKEDRGLWYDGCSNLWRARILQRIMAQGGYDLVTNIPTPVGVEYHAQTWAEGVTL